VEGKLSEAAKATAAEIKAALAMKHRGGRDYFLTEVKSGPTWQGAGLRILDAVAVRKSWAQPHITGYEVKISRGDFAGDAKFYTYLPLVHELYIAAPRGLIQREETPTEIGLIWYDPEKKGLTTKKKPPPRDIEVSADMLLYIIFSRLEPDRLPFHSSKAEYWRDWLEGKRSNRDLGRDVGGKMAREIARLEKELARSERFGRGGSEREAYDALVGVMMRNGLRDYDDPAEWLGLQFARGCSGALEEILSHAEAIKRAIGRAKANAGGPGQATATNRTSEP